MVNMDVHVSSHLKEELAWVQINGFGISVIMLFEKQLYRSLENFPLELFCS